MSRFIDRTGRQYGTLTVKTFSHRGKKNRVSYWDCECSCGNRVVVAGNNLTSGNSTNCGCRHGVRIDDPITLEQLKTVLRYEPETGKWFWLVQTRGSFPGDEAGGPHPVHEYIRLSIGSQTYYSSVLAWFYMTGEWPATEIDHRDTDRTNNRWGNLRLATHSQNMYNRSVTVRNKTGYKGVIQYEYGFTARIVHAKTLYCLGTFSDPVQAAKAYDREAIRLHGRFARTNFGM